MARSHFPLAVSVVGLLLSSCTGPSTPIVDDRAKDPSADGGSAGTGGNDSSGSGRAGATGGSGSGNTNTGGTGGTGGSGGTGDSNVSDPCDTDNGGCDALVTCDSTGTTPACGACPSGYDDTDGDGTSCDAVLCGVDQRVQTNACLACPAGTTNAAGDDASGANTSCDPVLCGVDQRVQANACVACPAGTTNAAGDDATGANTSCDAVLCGVDQCVQANACVACPAGTTNAAGDDAWGANTNCDDLLNACDGTPICTSDYPCQDLAASLDYTCRGQFEDWPPTYSASDLTVNVNGTVTDSQSGLVWQQSVDANSYTWTAAAAYCTVLSLVGTGWRLPTKAELESIVDYDLISRAIDPTAFPNTPAELFWSSSPYVGLAGSAWVVSFFNGSSLYVAPPYTSDTSSVRCVR